MSIQEEVVSKQLDRGVWNSEKVSSVLILKVIKSVKVAKSREKGKKEDPA